jgi:hypothetical protein
MLSNVSAVTLSGEILQSNAGDRERLGSWDRTRKKERDTMVLPATL